MEHKQLGIDDIEFLKSLGHEMNTQDDDSQADPRFWVVAENKREYGIADGYEDGTVACGPDGITFDTVGEFVEYLIENGRLSEGDYDGGTGMSFEDILNDLDDSQFYVCNYRDMRDQIAPNTMFLTKRECREHIKKNDYHYKEPHTYAMTAWRSPQILRLFSILKNTDWGEIAALKAENEQLTAELDHMAKETASLAIESVKREKKLAKMEAEVQHWADAEKDGRLHITKVGIGGKLYEPNEYGDIYEWDVVSVGIGGCVGEDYLCDRDDGTDVKTFTYGDIGNGVYVTREAAENALKEG